MIKLKYFDAEDGLQRVGGNEGFYLKMLNTLYNDFGDASNYQRQYKLTDAAQEASQIIKSLRTE